MNGFGTSNNSVRYVKRLTDINGNYVGTISYTKRSVSKSLNKKKSLNYNFKAISSKVLKAKSYAEAARASGSIRLKISELRKKMKAQEMSEDEINRALMHAELVKRACDKKKKHLKAEEEAKAKKENDLTGKSKIKISSDFGDLSIEEFIKLIKKHRSQEEKELAKADMKYLQEFYRQKMKKYDPDREHNPSQNSAASLSIGGVEMEVPAPEPPPGITGETIDEAV